MHWSGNVLHFLRADVGELNRQLVDDLFVHRTRHADAADFGQTFQTCRDVDAITQQVAVALHHVTNRDADAKLHLATGRIGHVAGSQAFLDIDRAAHCLHRARKLGEHRITVNCVCPGFVETPMQSRELEWEATLRETTVDGVRRIMVDDTPLGRLEQPEDVARAVAFLLSDDARFITGEALAVNGGAYMD